MKVEELVGKLGLAVVKVLDRSHGHYLARGSDGSLYIVIATRRVLRRPRSLGIDFEGPMFGVKKYYIDYYLRSGTCDGVIWVYNGDAYIADSHSIREVVGKVGTCVKRGYEVICHYPVNAAKRVELSKGLRRWL